MGAPEHGPGPEQPGRLAESGPASAADVATLAGREGSRAPGATPPNGSTTDPTVGVTSDAMGDPASSHRGDAPLRIGQTVSRYVVLSRIGAGGMGEVWAAYDPELDRKVAIKLVLADRGGEDARARLLREAQALAKLQHANVVTVHDVGTLGQRVWVAMEFVEGVTLRAWSAQRQRSRAEVLSVMLDAAGGLQAAHRAGLIHRDFKPDNVMIAADGRVLVMDFGLARAGDRDSPVPSVGPPLDDARRPADEAAIPEVDEDTDRTDDSLGDRRESITSTGAVLGTPAYMAPEQHLGLPLDARADQFAFCVTLWEALHGERPFRGRSGAALMVAVTEGRIQAPPRAARSPAWLMAALHRGLAVDPSLRHADMGALMLALENGARRTARRALGGVALALVAVAAGAVGIQWTHRSLAAHACEAEAQALAQQWSADELGRVTAFLGDARPAVTARLETYLAAWTDAARTVCRAESLDAQWKPLDLERGRACLEDAAVVMNVVESASTSTDLALRPALVEYVLALESPARCADPGRLTDLRPPPSDDKRELRSLRTELTMIDLTARYGSKKAALERLDALEIRIAALGWAPLTTRWALDRATVQSSMGKAGDAIAALEEVYAKAIAADLHADAARAATALVETETDAGLRNQKPDLWLRLAAVAVEKADDPDALLAARLLRAESKLRRTRGEYDASLTAALAALDKMRAALGERHPHLGGVLRDLAEIELRRAQVDASRRYADEALALYVATLGDDHPHVSIVLTFLAELEARQERPEEAKRLVEKAIAIRQAAFGEQHPQVASAYARLGDLAWNDKDLATAEAHWRRAQAIREATLSPGDPDLAHALNNLASSATAQGRLEEARELAERSTQLVVAAHGTEHADYAIALNTQANIEWKAGNIAGAAALYERAVEVRSATAGPRDKSVALPLFNLALARVKLGEIPAAIADHKRALSIRTEVFGREHEHTLVSAMNLGNLLLDSGDPAGARPLFEQIIEVGTTKWSEAHWRVATAHRGLAKVEALDGALDAAEARLARVIAVADGEGGDASARVDARLDLAELLVTRPGRKGEARDQIAAARALADSLSDVDPETKARAKTITPPK